MPITYSIKIDTFRALIVTRCLGHVTLAEVKAHFQELAIVWPPVEQLDVLLDLTEQTSLPSIQDLEEVAAEIDAQIGRRRFGRFAVVTKADLRGSMQMFEVLVRRLFDEVEIFQMPLEALDWLVPVVRKTRHRLTLH
jgi:hypothetical protein